jgi:hypothetical protein
LKSTINYTFFGSTILGRNLSEYGYELKFFFFNFRFNLKRKIIPNTNDMNILIQNGNGLGEIKKAQTFVQIKLN